MLLHVERMRRTHAEFVRFIFSEEVVAAGMDHGVYGPADQGAYNRFYAGYFDVHLKASWNWKPYWGHVDSTGRPANVSLVHFHGPKPHEYFAHEGRGEQEEHAQGPRARPLPCAFRPLRYAGQEGRSPHSFHSAAAAAGVHGVFAQVSGGARKGRATSRVA